MLTRLIERRVAKSVEVDFRIRSLQAKAEEADERLRRLYTLVETGDVEPDNLLKSRIAALNLDRQITREALERAQGSRQSQIVIDDPRRPIQPQGGLRQPLRTAVSVPVTVRFSISLAYRPASIS